MESEKFNFAKSVFADTISHIDLTYNINGFVNNDYKSKTPAQTLKDGFGFCTEQVELSEILLSKETKVLEKYQLFAVPKKKQKEAKIDLSHAFLGIPDNDSWILFETGFRTRNRGGVRKFPTKTDGLNYVLKLYNQSLSVSNIPNIEDLALILYKYNFSAENLTFDEFVRKVMVQQNRII